MQNLSPDINCHKFEARMKEYLERELKLIRDQIIAIENTDQYINGWHDACNDLTYLTGKRDVILDLIEKYNKGVFGGDHDFG